MWDREYLDKTRSTVAMGRLRRLHHCHHTRTQFEQWNPLITDQWRPSFSIK